MKLSRWLLVSMTSAILMAVLYAADRMLAWLVTKLWLIAAVLWRVLVLH